MGDMPNNGGKDPALVAGMNLIAAALKGDEARARHRRRQRRKPRFGPKTTGPDAGIYGEQALFSHVLQRFSQSWFL
jgi:hypothetical protein